MKYYLDKHEINILFNYYNGIQCSAKKNQISYYIFWTVRLLHDFYKSSIIHRVDTLKKKEAYNYITSSIDSLLPFQNEYNYSVTRENKYGYVEKLNNSHCKHDINSISETQLEYYTESLD